MKNEMYNVMALLITLMVATYLFSEWTDYQFVKAESCWHSDTVKAIKAEKGFHPLNEYGEDTSCYVDFTMNGKKERQEQWNVGNCDGSEIDINIIDYTCH